MSKSVALRTELQRLLKTVTANVYYAIRPEALKYPCIVYEVRELTHDGGKTVAMLETDVLDYGTSTAQAEAIADHIQTALRKYHFINSQIQFTIYQGSRQSIQEEDKKIIRRRLTFEIQLHERGNE